MYGETTTTWPAHTAPGWTTLVTARNPGGHGVFQFFDAQDAGYADRVLGTGDFGCTTVWDWLAQQGWSAGLINVPMSHPPRDLPGYQVTWPLVKTLRYCRPPGLLAGLARAGAPFKPDIAAMYTGDLSYIRSALEHVRARTRSIEHLLNHHPVDVVMAVITEIDRVCHFYWHFADPSHPCHVVPENSSWQHAIRSAYAAIDECFGTILDLVGEDVPILLVSDHGFGPGHLDFAMNAALAEAGLLATRPDSDPGRYASWFHNGEVVVDFAQTKVYMPIPGCSAINVNLVGRQDEGTVTGDDAAALLAETAEILLAVRRPDTGARVFSSAVRREDAYPGAMCDDAPDLVLIPADEAVFVSPQFVGPTWSAPSQTGLHRHCGMWALRAPGLDPARRSSSVKLCDLMPTLLATLGLRFPVGIDGRPVQVGLSVSGPVDFLPDAADTSPATAPGSRIEDRDDDAVASAALRAMGYL